MIELTPNSGVPGAPVATANPDHQPIVPMAGGAPPRCTCGVIGGNGITAPLLADHLRECDPTYSTISATECPWQTSYGTGLTDTTCAKPTEGQEYCPEHMQDLKDDYPDDYKRLHRP